MFRNASESMKITSGGSVGIGATSPSNDVSGLHIAVASSTDQLYLERTGSATGKWWLGTASNSLYFFDTVANTFRMIINSSGNVGIGTTNPSAKLEISNSSGNSFKSSSTTTTGFNASAFYNDNSKGWAKYVYGSAYSGGTYLNVGANGAVQAAINTTGAITTIGAFDLLLGTNSTERMRITSGGQLLVNTTSNYGNIVGIDQATNYDGTSDSAGIRIFSSGGTDNNGDYHGAIQFSKGTGSAAISAVQDASDADVLGLAFFTHPSTTGTAASEERMRITSAGDVLFGGISSTPNGTSVYGSGFIKQSVGRSTLIMANSTTGAAILALFANPNGYVGNITTSGTSTAYNTSSDYRLKENVVEMTGALDRVDALKPSRFNFIADAEKTVDGFLAHEVAEVVPEAITGEKDAVEDYEVTPAVLDDEGNVIEEAVMGTRPVYQGIDQSKLVPLLVGAIQELKAEIELLKSQINN